VFTSSFGTDTFTLFKPNAVGVKPLNITVSTAPDAKLAIVLTFVNVLAPVILSVTLILD